MVKIQKITTILIFAFAISLIPNFFYNGNGALAACPAGCTEKEGYCINCPISCQWGEDEVTNKSCQPSEGTGEWTCGVEIPVGEVIDRTIYSAEKMLAEFEGMLESGKEMTNKADELLIDYKDWNCQDWCQTGCHKFYRITAGERQPDQDPRCPSEAQSVPQEIYAGDECKADAGQCKSCDQCGERCYWSERHCWDLSKEEIVSCPTKAKAGIEILTCEYRQKEGDCQEMCSPFSCWGCCGQYFWPIINAYAKMKDLQEKLTNDIEEKDIPEKFKRSYILEQLDFSRCELAQCWIPAEDYFDVLDGKKVGKHLLTCEQISQMGLFDDDQIGCLTSQVEDEEEEIEKSSWWQIIIDFFQDIWQMLTEWLDFGQEEGCYPTNYYCCQK